MEASTWFGEHWFDVVQTASIIIGFVFTVKALRRGETATRISNLIALKQEHRELWQELYDRPELFRILRAGADIVKQPVSDEEMLFVKTLFIHLDTVHQATKADLFIDIKGIRNDISDFMILPIPQAVWRGIRRFQNDDFIVFVEGGRSDKFGACR